MNEGWRLYLDLLEMCFHKELELLLKETPLELQISQMHRLKNKQIEHINQIRRWFFGEDSEFPEYSEE